MHNILEDKCGLQQRKAQSLSPTPDIIVPSRREDIDLDDRRRHP